MALEQDPVNAGVPEGLTALAPTSPARSPQLAAIPRAATRAPGMGPQEVEIMVQIFDELDYKMVKPETSDRNPRPHQHKSRVVDKVIKELKKQLGVNRTKIQIQKKWSDLQRREKQRLQRLRGKMAPRGSSQQEPLREPPVLAEEETAAASPPGPGTLEDVASPALALGAQEEVYSSGSPVASTSAAEPATSSVRNRILAKLRKLHARMDVVESKSRDHERKLRHLAVERRQIKADISSLQKQLGSTP